MQSRLSHMRLESCDAPGLRRCNLKNAEPAGTAGSDGPEAETDQRIRTRTAQSRGFSPAGRDADIVAQDISCEARLVGGIEHDREISWGSMRGCAESYELARRNRNLNACRTCTLDGLRRQSKAPAGRGVQAVEEEAHRPAEQPSFGVVYPPIAEAMGYRSMATTASMPSSCRNVLWVG